MADSNTTLQNFQIMHLSLLHDLGVETNQILYEIESKLDSFLEKDQREVLVANVLFASEKVFSIMEQITNPRERLFLLSQTGYLFVKDLPLAQRKTANIAIKRDIDSLIMRFNAYAAEITKEEVAGFEPLRRTWQIQAANLEAARNQLLHIKMEERHKFWKYLPVLFFVWVLLFKHNNWSSFWWYTALLSAVIFALGHPKYFVYAKARRVAASRKMIASIARDERNALKAIRFQPETGEKLDQIKEVLKNIL